MLSIDWRHHGDTLQLWLKDDTRAWQQIGSCTVHQSVQALATEIGFLNAMLGAYDTIEAALPELAQTNLKGIDLAPYKPPEQRTLEYLVDCHEWWEMVG